MFPSSASPAPFEGDDEDGDAVERSIAVAKQQHTRDGGDGIVANTYPLDNSQLLPLPPPSGGGMSPQPARPPSTSPAPPVYDPMIPPVQHPPPSRISRTSAYPSHSKYGLPPSLVPPSRNTEPYIEDAIDGDDNDEDEATSLTLTPEERKRLQKLLEVQQKKERGTATKKPSYWERVWGRRRDIGKLVMLAFVILFALAVHAAAVHYISTYIDLAGDDPSFWIELALRVGYPILVLIALWALKVHVSTASETPPQAVSAFRSHRQHLPTRHRSSVSSTRK